MAELSSNAAVMRRDRARERPGRPHRRRRRSLFQVILQVIGELLITAGVVLLLFVAWELWWTNIESDIKQEQAVEDFFSGIEVPLTPEAPSADEGDIAVDAADPPVLPAAEFAGKTFGVVYVPRFGENFSRPVTGGVGVDVLDNLGLGHYPDTAMPGQVGNFAIAGHRQTNGAVLDNIHTLVPGDKVYVQTRDGYYTYVYRNNQIVLPDRVDVLAPVPTQPDAEPTERILTMTSCNPRFGAQERIIAYAVMESYRPSSAGPPPEIAAQVERAAGQVG